MIYSSTFRTPSVLYLVISVFIIAILLLCDVLFNIKGNILGPVLVFVAYMQRVLRHCRVLEEDEDCFVLRNKLIPFLKKVVSKDSLVNTNLCKSRFYNGKSLEIQFDYINGKKKCYELGCMSSDNLSNIALDIRK